MQDAIDNLIAALAPYPCAAVHRQADKAILITVTDLGQTVHVTRAIPVSELQSELTIETIVQDLKRDLNDAIGVLSQECVNDLRIRGARLIRFNT